MLIYKEKLPTDTIDIRCVELPYKSAEEARQAVLHVGLQYGEPCMWYDAITHDLPTNKYLILAVGTGHYWGKYHDEETLTNIQTIDFRLRLPERFLHICNACGKREILSSKSLA